MIRVLSLGAVLMLASCGPTTAVKCTAANCSGCCTEADECLGNMKQSPQACGSSGGVCRVCLPQQLCSAGACVRNPDAGLVLDDAGTQGQVDAGTDSGVSCGNQGEPCCANNACFIALSCNRGYCGPPPQDAGPCGGIGEMCCSGQSCTAANSTCNGTTCVAVTGQDAGTDAGTPLKVTGDSCSLNRECIDGSCLVLGFNGGYCTRSCSTSVDCVAGSQCGVNPSGVGPARVCLKQCSSPGQSPGGCRTSYVCESHAGTSGVPVCFPGCTSSTMCGLAPTCDSRGFCCGVAGFVCCENSTCQTGNTCSNGNCVAGGSGGGGGTATGGGGGTATGGGGGTATGGGGGGTPTGGGTGTGGGTAVRGGVGSPCTNWVYDCTGNACFTQAASAQWVGGYCTEANCTANSCPAGSSCWVTGSTNYCLKTCTWDGGQGDCRAGYVCDRYITGSTTATCTAACSNASQCGGSLGCSNGFCCGGNRYRCCAGNVCNAGAGTCTNGYCL